MERSSSGTMWTGSRSCWGWSDLMVFCINCGKYFNSGVPKLKKEDDVNKVTIAFCSEECQKMYG